MPRRRRKSEDTISLFPFLSVLTCAIGVLIVIISGQNLLAFGDSDQLIEIGSQAEQEEQPIYVECDGDGIIIHPEQTRVPIASLYESSKGMKQLLGQLQAGPGKKYLVLLVRPSGIDSYERCLRIAKQKDIKVGKDALLSGGDVIFTAQGQPIVVAEGNN